MRTCHFEETPRRHRRQSGATRPEKELRQRGYDFCQSIRKSTVIEKVTRIEEEGDETPASAIQPNENP